MLHKSYKIRILIVFLFLLLLFCAVVARLYQLQIRNYPCLIRKADEIHLRKMVINPFRGEIVDCQGNVLAVTTRLRSIYVNPSLIPGQKKRELAKSLSSVLVMPVEKIMGRLESQYDNVAVARKVADDKIAQVQSVCQDFRFKKNEIYFSEESKRLYPMGKHLAPVLGYTQIDDTGDNKGIFGLELQYNDWISGKYEEFTTERTALRQHLEPIEQDILDSTYGNRLILTIDQNIQYCVESELRKGLADNQADSGVAIVQDVRTGAILAMCSLPSFDPDEFSTYDAQFRRNRSISDPFEPGSVMKIFTTAILLDMGLVQTEEIIDCEMGRAVIEGRHVTDSGGHKLGKVPFSDTFYNSSNVAFTKLGLRIDPSVYFLYLRTLGFGQKTGIDLPDESSGILHPLTKWTRLSRTSLPIGYEIGTTALQVICGLSAMGNGGKLMRPFLVKEIQDYKGRLIQEFTPQVRAQIVNPQTADKMLFLMEGVVEYGTGKKARIPGYRIAGKTGTTRKSHKGDAEYIAGFAGLFPVDNPTIACYVAIDNPKSAYYAAEVAVPVFKGIAHYILSYLAIPPSLPVGNTVVAKATPAPSPESTPLAPKTMATAEGLLPDFSGLTMKDVLVFLKESPLEVKFIGSGIVIDQSPNPATPLKDVKMCILIFGKPYLSQAAE